MESALQALGIKCVRSSTDSDLVKFLNDAILFPSSQNEWEISRTIKSIIETNVDPDKADDMINHLKELASYSEWD